MARYNETSDNEVALLRANDWLPVCNLKEAAFLQHHVTRLNEFYQRQAGAKSTSLLNANADKAWYHFALATKLANGLKVRKLGANEFAGNVHKAWVKMCMWSLIKHDEEAAEKGLMKLTVVDDRVWDILPHYQVGWALAVMPKLLRDASHTDESL